MTAPTGSSALHDLGTEQLRAHVAGQLTRCRDRSLLLTGAVDDDDLVKQHSRLMSPLVWDLAHVGNQPPASYLQAKEPEPLKFPDGHQRARFDPKLHASEVTPAAPDMTKTAEALEKAKAPKAPEAAVEKKAEPAPEPAPAPAEAAEEPRGRNGGKRR